MSKFIKPTILNSTQLRAKAITEFCKQNSVIDRINIYDLQISELFEIMNPGQNSTPRDLKNFKDAYQEGLAKPAGVFYPWSKTLLICLSDEALSSLRTNRNQYLIKSDEQKKLENFTIGIAGMSVGASIANSLIYSGFSKHIKVADNDNLSTTNLNRLNETLVGIGKQKVHLLAQHIFEINPFANVDVFDNGLVPDNLRNFFNNPKLDLIVEEIDDFKMKFRLRVEAKSHRVPLLMFTNIGDGILIDVERYDTDPNTIPFNGLLGDDPELEFSYESITNDLAKKLAIKLVGQEFIPTRALESVVDIGKNLTGRPQLYSTVATSSGIASYVVRQIALGVPIDSGRYFIKIPDLLDIESIDYEDSPARTLALERIIKRA